MTIREALQKLIADCKQIDPDYHLDFSSSSTPDIELRKNLDLLEDDFLNLELK